MNKAIFVQGSDTTMTPIAAVLARSKKEAFSINK